MKKGIGVQVRHPQRPGNQRSKPRLALLPRLYGLWTLNLSKRIIFWPDLGEGIAEVKQGPNIHNAMHEHYPTRTTPKCHGATIYYVGYTTMFMRRL